MKGTDLGKDLVPSHGERLEFRPAGHGESLGKAGAFTGVPHPLKGHGGVLMPHDTGGVRSLTDQEVLAKALIINHSRSGELRTTVSL